MFEAISAVPLIWSRCLLYVICLLCCLLTLFGAHTVYRTEAFALFVQYPQSGYPNLYSGLGALLGISLKIRKIEDSVDSVRKGRLRWKIKECVASMAFTHA